MWGQWHISLLHHTRVSSQGVRQTQKGSESEDMGIVRFTGPGVEHGNNEFDGRRGFDTTTVGKGKTR